MVSQGGGSRPRRQPARSWFMCEQGRGVPMDNVQAYLWFELAASQSLGPETDDKASADRDRVAAKMTPDQIAKAQRMAREWKPK